VLGPCIETADRRLDPGFKQPFRILNGYVLAATFALLDQATPMQWPSFMQSLLQRIKHKPRICRGTNRRADNPGGKGINDEGNIDKAGPGRDTEQFQTKWKHLAIRKMRQKKILVRYGNETDRKTH
jgi:hypothetical protein